MNPNQRFNQESTEFGSESATQGIPKNLESRIHRYFWRITIPDNNQLDKSLVAKQLYNSKCLLVWKVGNVNLLAAIQDRQLVCRFCLPMYIQYIIYLVRWSVSHDTKDAS